MKKSTKIALALLVCGMVCCIAAGLMGVGKMLANDPLIDLSETSEDKNLVVDSSVQRIELDIDAAEVMIQEGESWSLTAGPSTWWRISGETLKIGQISGIHWLQVSNTAPIVLTVPSDSVKIIDIELDAGNVEMSGLTIEQSVTCSVDAGAVSMKRMTVHGTLNVDCDAGQIDFSGIVCNTITADCDMGQIDLELLRGSTVGRVSGDVDMGTLNLSINGSSYLNGGALSNDIFVDLPGSIGSDLLTVNCDMGTVNVNLITE